MIGQLRQLFLLLRVWFFSVHHGRLGKIKWILRSDCQPGVGKVGLSCQKLGIYSFFRKKKKRETLPFGQITNPLQYNTINFITDDPQNWGRNIIIYTGITILKTNCDNYWTIRLYNVISICLKKPANLLNHSQYW